MNATAEVVAIGVVGVMDPPRGRPEHQALNLITAGRSLLEQVHQAAQREA